jgi:long-chain acyl-CoA synthetase
MTTDTPDLSAVRTVPELLAFRAAATPAAEAYRAFDPATSRWESLSWAQARDLVTRWSDALAASGLPAGARVAILLPNGLAAMSADQATLALGGVPVPLHAIDNPGSIAYILADCEASLLIVEQRSQWERIRDVGTPLPALQGVVVAHLEPGPQAVPTGEPPITALADWLAGGRSDAPRPPAPTENDLAAIVYTSGTTGKPKGVMLTHRNVVANVKAVLGRVVPRIDDVFLSFLPLSHTFERTAGYYLPIACGSCVAYARSVALLAEDLKTVRPTVLISVPRIYERVHAKVLERLAASPFKARLFHAAQHVGWRRFCRTQRLPLPAGETGVLRAGADALAWPLLRRLAAEPLLAQFGGRVRTAVSGGAALSPTIAHAFLGLGLPLLQGYGMTETSPVVAANGLDDNDPLTIGRALPGVEVRIGENRELQVRGPSVMRGYWNRPEETVKVLSPDGWMSTGDQASITDGRIRILGRIKEIIVTSTGEKVPPADLELTIAGDPLFEQVFVLGENRPFIACIAVLQQAEWQRLARQLALNPDDPAALNTPAAHQAVLARIAAQAAHFPHYAMPRSVWLTLVPWTIENTLLTPTLKLKRLNLMNHFASEINGLYQRPVR